VVKAEDHAVLKFLASLDQWSAMRTMTHDLTWTNKCLATGPLAGSTVLHLLAGQRPQRMEPDTFLRLLQRAATQVNMCQWGSEPEGLWRGSSGTVRGGVRGYGLGSAEVFFHPARFHWPRPRVHFSNWSSYKASGILDARNGRGMTALHLAASQGNRPMVDALLAAGAGSHCTVLCCQNYSVLASTIA